MSRIEDPINDVDDLRQLLKEKKKYQAYNGDYIYMTIPSCGEVVFNQTEEKGWVHVHIFEGDDYGVVDTLNGNFNTVIFRRKAPEFYDYDNPWLEKGPLTWLPNLDARIPPKLKPLMEESSPNGGPCIARRYRCGCGEKKLHIQVNEELGRVEAVCTECGDRKILMDKKALRSDRNNPIRPDQVGLETLKNIKCKCNTKILSPLYAIEYSPEANEGWEFDWLKIIALCRNCGHSWFIAETATK